VAIPLVTIAAPAYLQHLPLSWSPWRRCGWRAEPFPGGWAEWAFRN